MKHKLTPRQRVLRKYPSARLVKHVNTGMWCIYRGTFYPKRGTCWPISNYQITSADAWADAASTLKDGKEGG